MGERFTYPLDSSATLVLRMPDALAERLRDLAGAHGCDAEGMAVRLLRRELDPEGSSEDEAARVAAGRVGT